MDYAAGIQLLWIQLTTATILHKGASYKISYSIVKVYYLPMFSTQIKDEGVFL